MDINEILIEIARLEDVKRKEINVLLGASEDQFGANLSDLRNLSKIIGQDQNLAFNLWETKNEDAMILSTMIMDPEDISITELDEIVKDVTYHTLADEFTFNVVLESGWQNEVYSIWLLSENPAVQRVAWNIVIAKMIQGEYYDLDFGALLNLIAANIKKAPMVLQEVLNRALIEIGIRYEDYSKKALEIAKDAGKLHGRNAKWQVIPYAFDEIIKGKNRIKY